MKIQITFLLLYLFGLVDYKLFGESSSLLGIDFGSEFIKVSILSPGKGFNILINNQSKRKITNAISFANRFRSYDEEAKMFSTKHPHLTLLNSNSFLAYNIFDKLKSKENFSIEDFDENDDFYVDVNNYDFESEISSKYYSYDYNIDRKRGTLNIKLKNDIELSSEDITANLLSYIKKLAYTHLNIDYKNNKDVDIQLGCVIAVPCNFSQRKKQALYHATQIAGLELLGIIHGVTSAAIHNVLDLALNTTKLTMYLDIGSKNINVGIATISNIEKNKSASRSVKMYACETLENSSGNKIDIILAEYLRKKFEQQHNLSIINDKKAMRKLLAASNKAKLLLSAKRSAEVYIESLHSNKSLVENVTREEFENAISEILENIKIPIYTALKKSAFELKDIEALELIGSAWRVPKVLEAINNFFQPLKVGMHLNSDEAITMGSLYIAAYNSANFRIKDLTYTDIIASDFQIVINTEEVPISEEEEKVKNGENGNGEQTENSVEKAKQEQNKNVEKKMTELNEGKNHMRELIAYNSKYPIIKNVILKYKDNLKFYIYENETIISKYSVGNLDEETKKKFEHLNPPKLSLKFKADRYGILNLENAFVYFEEEKEIITKKKEEETEVEKKEKKTEEMGEKQKEAKEGPIQQNEKEEKTEEKKNDNQEQKEKEKEDDKQQQKEEKKEEKEQKTDDKPEDATVDKKEENVIKKTETIKHKFLLPYELSYTIPIPLTNEEIDAKKTFLKSMDEHDINIFLKAEAKNTLESFIYETRSKLKQELYKQVSEENVRTEYFKKLEEYEEWLYMENDEPLENVHSKLKELKDVYEPIKERAYEFEVRDQVIEKTNKLIRDMNEKIANVADKKPWALETVKLVKGSLDKEIAWWNNVQQEQKKLNSFATPAFKAQQVESKFRAIGTLIETLEKLKKPVEKKPSKKQEKTEEKKEEKKEEEEKRKEEENVEQNNEQKEEHIEEEQKKEEQIEEQKEEEQKEEEQIEEEQKEEEQKEREKKEEEIIKEKLEAKEENIQDKASELKETDVNAYESNKENEKDDIQEEL